VINVNIEGTGAQQKDDQSSVTKIMKAPANPFEKRNLSYTTTTPKDGKVLAKKMIKKKKIVDLLCYIFNIIIESPMNFSFYFLKASLYIFVSFFIFLMIKYNVKIFFVCL
jgi:hypothetical protein